MDPSMRAANRLLVAVATAWLALAWLGREVTLAIFDQGPGIAPNAGQIDYYLVYPFAVLALLLFAGWLGNMTRREPLVRWTSLVAAALLLPYLFGYTGGM